MREIEGIESVVKSLKPHWSEIERHFAQENARFIELTAFSSGDLGRVLKCHLVIENYLDRFLQEHYDIDDYSRLRLSFYNKALMLPSRSSTAAFVKPGIIEINEIRNRCAHNVTSGIEIRSSGPIQQVLDVVRPGAPFNNDIAKIEAFTTVACTWLIVPPPRLQKLFTEAFSSVAVAIARMGQ
jgi:hypothetical protein